MTQEEKELLLIDLGSRIKYQPNMASCHDFPGFPSEIKNSGKLHGIIKINGDWLIETYNEGAYLGKFEIFMMRFIPYLRSMSSMTEKEKEWYKLNAIECNICAANCASSVVDWLNRHHFDYRGLIEKGLALEAPEGMYDLKDE